MDLDSFGGCRRTWMEMRDQQNVGNIWTAEGLSNNPYPPPPPPHSPDVLAPSLIKNVIYLELHRYYRSIKILQFSSSTTEPVARSYCTTEVL